MSVKFLVQVESAVNPKCKCAELLNVNMLLHEKKKTNKRKISRCAATIAVIYHLGWGRGGRSENCGCVAIKFALFSPHTPPPPKALN